MSAFWGPRITQAGEWFEKTGSKMGMWDWPNHLPADEELAILVDRWGPESPWCKEVAQLLKISPVVS